MVKTSTKIHVPDKKVGFTVFHIPTKSLKTVSSSINRVRPYGARSHMANAEKIYVRKGKRVSEVDVDPPSRGFAISMRSSYEDERKVLEAQTNLRKNFMIKVFKIMKKNGATVKDYDTNKFVTVSEYLR